MKYKIGDKVRIKSLDWYNQNKDENGFVLCGNRIFDNYMSVFCGSVVTICGEYSYYCGYDIREDMQCRTWTDDMFEGLADAEPQEKIVSLKQMCEWLRNNIDFYVETKYDEDFRVDIEQLLNDICKAM